MNANLKDNPKPGAGYGRFFSVIHGRHSAWVFLGVSLLLTLLAWYLTHRHVARRHQERFAFRIGQVKERIEERMLEYEQVLRGGVGLFRGSQSVSRAEWREYVKQCELQRYFPGIQAMALAIPVPAAEKSAHEERVRREGFPDYRIYPAGDRDLYSSIIYIEPFDWRNRRAFGYDMYSEPHRRQAMDRAAKTGQPAISSKITLVQETDEDVQAGVLCYLPLYRKDASLDSVAARQQALRGWVYAAFRFDDLMQGIVGDTPTGVTFRIYDSLQEAPEHLLFDSDGRLGTARPERVAGFSASMPIRVSGRDWVLRFGARPQFVNTGESSLSLFVAFGGLLIDLLLFAIIFSIGRQREVALRMANKMTRELRESEKLTRSIVENASEAILYVSETGAIAAANAAARFVFRAQGPLVRTSFDDLLVDGPFQELTGPSSPPIGRESGIAVRCRRRDGEVFPCRIFVGKVVVEGETSFIVIAQDETMRIESERKMAEIHCQLVDSSRQAGMAEVATCVLHSVGNVLNSVNVSANLLRERINATPVDHLTRASDIISEHADDLGSFLTNDRQGKNFPVLLDQLAASFEREREAQIQEISSLHKNVEHIKEIVAMQQSFATRSGDTELVDPAVLFEDAIKINETGLRRHGVKLQRNFEEVPRLQTRKHDLLQILINLIKNAKQACTRQGAGNRVIRLTIRQEGEFIRLDVADNGIGISKENLTRIFRRSFTTRKSGNGYGLHSSAITAQALGGSLSVHSDGEGRGATFTVKLPVRQATADDDRSAGSETKDRPFLQDVSLDQSLPSHPQDVTP